MQKKRKMVNGVRRTLYNLDEADFANLEETWKTVQKAVHGRIRQLQIAGVDLKSYALNQYRKGIANAERVEMQGKAFGQYGTKFKITTAMQFLNAPDSSPQGLRRMEEKRQMEWQDFASKYGQFMDDRGYDLFESVKDAMDAELSEDDITDDTFTINRSGHKLVFDRDAFDAQLNRIYAGLTEKAKYVLYSSDGKEVGYQVFDTLIKQDMALGISEKDMINHIVERLDSRYLEYYNYQKSKYGTSGKVRAKAQEQANKLSGWVRKLEE